MFGDGSYPSDAGFNRTFFLMFRMNWRWRQKLFIPVVAATVGFVVNGIRVALMAVLVAKGDKGAFAYWHEGDGSLIFSLIAVALFFLFCWFLLWINKAKSQKVSES